MFKIVITHSNKYNIFKKENSICIYITIYIYVFSLFFGVPKEEKLFIDGRMMVLFMGI